MGIFAGARARIAFLASATLGALFSAQSSAQHFAPPAYSDSGAAPSSIVAADFDGDGWLDLAIAYTRYLPGNNGKVGIKFNSRGSPTFPFATGPAAEIPGAIDVERNPVHIATGVFNNSGRNDLAVVNQGDDSISILLNDGSGVFSAGATLATGTSPAMVVVGDFDGDGNADLAVTNTTAGTVSVFLGNGSGAFSAAPSSPLLTGLLPTGIDAADMDGDGVLDLVVANTGAQSLAFHKGNGNGTFQAAVTSNTFYLNPVRVKAGLLNGDGFRDVAVASQGTGAVTPDGGFEILLGTGTGTFSASDSTRRIDENFLSRFAFGLWDGDRRNDVAYIRSSDNLTGFMTSQMGPVAPIETNALDLLTAVDLVAGDFDGDGATDLAVLARVPSPSFDNYLMVLRKTHEVPVFLPGTLTATFTLGQPATGSLNQFLASGVPFPTWSKQGGGTSVGPISFNPTTGAFSGTPGLGTAGIYSAQFFAENQAGQQTPNPTSINFEVLRAPQTVTFNSPSNTPFWFSPITLTASAPSTGAFNFASLTPTICTVNGANLSAEALGTCTLTATNFGDPDYLEGTTQHSFTITPGPQSISFTAPAARRFGDGGFTFGAGVNQGSATATSNLPVTVGSLTTGVCTVDVSGVVTPVTTGQCQLSLNQAGGGVYGPAPQEVAQFSISPNTVPGAPTVSIVNRGNASATVHFFAATDNGGAPIEDYTATCGTQSSAASLTSPLVVSGLTNGTQVGCTVKARNVEGSGPPSNSVNVTPALAPAITSSAFATFTRGQPGTFTATATGDPAPTFSINGTLPSNVTINPITGEISGTPPMGSSFVYLVELVATNIGGTASQYLSLTVAKLSQTISFTQPPNKAIGSGNALMTATATATGPVMFGTTTPTICTASSNSISLLAIGTCTVTANHTGDPDYLAAPQVALSFQVTPNTPDVPSNPVATPGNGQATFTFGPPVNNGGAPVIDYTVTCTPGTFSATGTASPLTITGLTNGAQYSCVLRARNSIGLGGPWFFGVIPGKLANTINFTQPANVVFGSVASVPLTATATAGTPVTFTSNTPPTCTISGSSAVLVAIGTCEVIANHPGNVDYDAAPQVLRSFSITGGAQVQVTPASLDFGGQSMQTTSAAKPVTVNNPGSSPVTVTAVELTSNQFAQTNNCTTVAAGGSCTVSVTFTPAASTTASVPVNATLTVKTQEAGNAAVTLAGTGERSLVTHYYASILGRAPDAGGKAFWASEAARVQGLGVNVNEVWFAMAQAFYFSGEYLALNRSDSGYITDLYNTFFNRTPDQGGLTFWRGQLTGGMPREVALASFMFSAEFASFTNAIFGNTAARAEVDAVVDFYRGLLARLPDDGGFAHWVGKFRAAQCSNPASGRAAAVVAEVEAISSAYALSAEYAARARTNVQYIGDLYNAFLRRGGDLGGVLFWINQVASGAQTREQVRIAFKNSAEFNTRVQAIIAQGCQGN